MNDIFKKESLQRMMSAFTKKGAVDETVAMPNRAAFISADGEAAPKLELRSPDETMPLGVRVRIESKDVALDFDTIRESFMATPVGLAQIALDGTFLLVNYRFCEMLSYSVEELIGKEFLPLVHPEEAELDVAHFIERLSSSPQASVAERRFIRKDGGTVWVRRSAKLIRDGAGDPRFIIISTNDVSEQRQADEALRKANAFLVAVIGNAPIAVYTEKESGTITSWNRAAERMFGYSAQQAIGQYTPFVRPEFKLEADTRRARVMQGEAFPSQEFERLRSDGSTITVSASLTPLFDGKGLVTGVIGMAADVTETKRARGAMESSEARFRVMTESAQDMVAILNADTSIKYISSSLKRLLGHTPEELIGSLLTDLAHVDDRDRLRERLALTSGNQPQNASNEPNLPLEFRLQHKNGAWRWLESLTTNCLTEPNIQGLVINARDITDRKAAQERVQFLAYHDNLTGLPNRLLLQDRVSQAIARAQRTNRRLAVMFVDLDNFKNVNDSLGHDAGDNLLTQVAGRLKGCIRTQDTIARQGGDEFIVLLEDLLDSQGAATVGEKVLSSLRLPFRLPQGEGKVSCSMGIAMFPDDGRDAVTLLRNADTAMFHGKASGKNTFQFFTDKMNLAVQRRAALEAALRSPERNQFFFLEYQPQVWLSTRERVGVEALVRWRHEGKVIMPGDFISLAEDAGLIQSMGHFVLHEACRQAKIWIDAGKHLSHVSINVSARELRDPGFAPMLVDTLDATGLDPELLELEINETHLMTKLDGAAPLLAKFTDMGIVLTIDDFGVGQSSLSNLRRLPISKLKIDGSFVRDMQTDSNDAAIVQAIITMAQSLGMQTVAEGVETEKQRDMLERMGCELAQGYLFGEPALSIK